MKRRNWTREELILTINLYCKTPFGRLHKGNPDVIELARLINRTPSAVAWKLVNFASLDPSLQARGIKGASNTSNQDKNLWDEFYRDWENLAFESEILMAKYKHIQIEYEYDVTNRTGTDVQRLIKSRVNQSFFRSTILASYNNTCCITGIKNTKLLVAGHIIPWAADKENRLNPRNGLLINSLHDRAFESGYMAIDDNYRIQICSEMLNSNNQTNKDYFIRYHNQEIILPTKFLPDKEFLRIHYNERFLK